MQALLAAVAGIAIQLDQQEISDAAISQVRAAIREYQTWQRVSDLAHWAPTLCSIPSLIGAQLSDSKDERTHGKKLYFLFARDASAYWAVGTPESAQQPPNGQSIVKESWTHTRVPGPPKRIDLNARVADQNAFREFPPEFALLDGQWHRTDKPAGLFIMTYLGEDNPNTDAGWIYATTNPSGDQINSIGLIESCMGCHTKAPHGRLFGLPYARR